MIAVSAESLMWLFALLTVVSAVAGVAAGMFGIGGGVLIVPALYSVFGVVGVEADIRMHAAVATSLATIVLTSIRSALAHRRHNAIDEAVVRRWTPWIVAGAFIGSLTAHWVPGAALTAVFGLGLLVVASRFVWARSLPLLAARPPLGPAGAGAGAGLGFVSSWLGIGGGVFGVMLLSLTGLAIHRAVATASVFGAAIGAPAALGFIITGLGVDGLAPLSLGYVNVPAFLTIVTVTTLTAPIGAQLAHAMSQERLQRVLAAVLCVVAVKMIADSALVSPGADPAAPAIASEG